LRGTLIEPPGDIARSARMPRRADTPPWPQRVPAPTPRASTPAARESPRRLDNPLVALAMGSAAGLATVDLYCVARQRVRLIYLLDAIAEAALVAAWLVRTPRDHRR
jgi:hypothetical protein